MRVYSPLIVNTSYNANTRSYMINIIILPNTTAHISQLLYNCTYIQSSCTLLTIIQLNHTYHTVGFLMEDNFHISQMNGLPFVKLLLSKCLLKTFIIIAFIIIALLNISTCERRYTSEWAQWHSSIIYVFYNHTIITN